MYAGAWTPNQQNLVLFVLVDSDGLEVPGLGNAYVMELSKAGAAFVASAGAKAEIGSGWYSYLTTAAEADTPGPIALKATGAGVVQQNLEYVVLERTVNAPERDYIVTNSITLAPVADVHVWITSDLAGTSILWSGDTDALGYARDGYGYKPRLPAGTFYFWKYKLGFTDDQGPDTEVFV